MLNIILIIFISFIPIVLWAYIFSSLSEKILNKKRFIIGIFSGAISVLPIYYLENIINYINIGNLDFFELARNITSYFTALNFGFSLSLFFLIIVFLSFIFGLFFRQNGSIISSYIKNILIFIFFISFILTIFYFINLASTSFGFLNDKLDYSAGVNFGETIFNTFKLIIFYYVLIAFIEEGSKHFNFIGTSILDIKNVKQGVLYAIFVALGFSFIENILYFYNLYISSGISFELTKTYFFRSIFSIMVHVFASSVIAYFFTKAYLSYKEKKQLFPYIKTFFIGLSIGILLHFFFDFAITIGFSFIIILYFVVGYLYVSSIFYTD